MQNLKLVDWGLRLAVGSWVSCQQSFCLALPARLSSPYHFDSTGSQRNQLALLLDAVLEEIYTGMRGSFLFLLFLPLILTSPVCIGLGIGRASWVQVQPAVSSCLGQQGLVQCLKVVHAGRGAAPNACQLAVLP